MAHWQDAAVTNDGVEMLNEWMAGRNIKVVSAYGGTGTVSVDKLTEQTGLVDQRQRLNLVGEENSADGKTVQVQVSNTGLTEEYELNQVGVYALLDPGKETETEPKMLFIMQDEKGVTVPPVTEVSFLLELYCKIGITNNGRFQVSIDSAGVATIGRMKEELDRLAASILTRRWKLRPASLSPHGAARKSGRTGGLPPVRTTAGAIPIWRCRRRWRL